MAEDFMSSDVKCPFYRRSSNNSISCENIVDGAAGTVSTFMNRSLRNRFMRKYCCDEYRRCTICQICEKKYK